MFGFFFCEGPITNFEQASEKADTAKFARFHRAMLEEGVYLAPSQFEAGFTGLAHTGAWGGGVWFWFGTGWGGLKDSPLCCDLLNSFAVLHHHALQTALALSMHAHTPEADIDATIAAAKRAFARI
jgi:hypothetical protein